MPELQVLVHPRPSQVDESVPQTCLIGDVLVVFDLERRCFGSVQNCDIGRQQFDRTSRQVRVVGAGATLLHDALYLYDPLAP